MQEALMERAEAAGLAALELLGVRAAQAMAAEAEQLAACIELSLAAQGPAGPERYLLIDVAGTLRIGQGAAARRMDMAERLVRDLPHTLAGLRAGTLLVGQARQVLEQTLNCTGPVARHVDAALAAVAAACPDGMAGWYGRRLTDKLKRLIARAEAELDADATRRREDTARAGRTVLVRPEPDGMGSLWALLPAEKLRAFSAGLDELSRRQRALDRAAGISRSADQRRADLLAALPALALAAGRLGPASGLGAGGVGPDLLAGLGVVVNVHIPLATSLGQSQAPGYLDGYGPISADHARLLLPGAALRAIWVDEHTGQVLGADPHLHRAQPAPGADQGASRRNSKRARPADPPGHDSTTEPGQRAEQEVHDRIHALLPDAPIVLHDLPEPQHDPSTALARLVRLRQPLCTGPGCSQSAHRSDLDHEDPWPHGPTAARNLGPKSRRCHRAKTFTWTVTRHPDGRHTWTSPTGRSYPVPAFWEPPPEPTAPLPALGSTADDTGADNDDEDDDTDDSTLTQQLDQEHARLAAAQPVAVTTWQWPDEPPF